MKKRKWYLRNRIVSNLLYRYVDWERMWREPRCRFKDGDVLKTNWKYNVNISDEDIDSRFVFRSLLEDGVATVDTEDAKGTCMSIYWLCKVKGE